MSSIRGVPAMDVLPEYFPYRDGGCDMSTSCLKCPLPQCKYDSDANGDRNWLQRQQRAQRDRQVLQTRHQEGATVIELSRRFRISQRTVHRILARSQSRRVGTKPSRTSDWQSFPQQPAR